LIAAFHQRLYFDEIDCDSAAVTPPVNACRAWRVRACHAAHSESQKSTLIRHGAVACRNASIERLVAKLGAGALLQNLRYLSALYDFLSKRKTRWR
jgi:hypothetical protein